MADKDTPDETKKSTETERIESAMEVLAELSERAVGNGRLRVAIGVVRDALWSDLGNDGPIYPHSASDDWR